MELDDAVRARRMVRTYRPDAPVATDVVERLLDLAVRAPSAGGTQGRDVVVLSSAADRHRFWSAAADLAAPDRWLTGMMTAPVVLLWVAHPGAYRERYARPDKARAAEELRAAAELPAVAEDRWPVPWWDVDTGMAALLVLLGAVQEGLGACFAGVPGPRHEAVKAAFDVTADRRLVGIVTLGHPVSADDAPAAGSTGHEEDGRTGAARRPTRRARSARAGRDLAHDGRFGRRWGG